MSLNKVMLIGNLGADPELRHTSSQMAVSTLRIATGERRKDQSGNWVEHTEWHSVVTFGKTAENCSQFLAKGRQVFVEGRLQTRKWQDKEGKDRYSTEIIANTVQFLGGKSATGNVTVENSSRGSRSSNVLDSIPTADSIDSSDVEISFDDDDIPF